MAAPTLTEKFGLMETILTARMNADIYGWERVQHAVRTLARMDGTLSIRDLSDGIGMSQKHLNTQFKRMVGVTPKSLARVMKLQNVLYSIDPRQPANWADIAYSCHYYDQAHFNRDFQAFTGLNPTTYARLRADVFGDLQPGQNIHFVPIG